MYYRTSFMNHNYGDKPMGNKKSKNRTVTILRWIARILGVLYIAFFLLMFIGEELSSNQESNPIAARELMGLVFDFVYFVGLIVAWKWEGLGGLIAAIGLVAFAITIPDAAILAYTIMAVPVILFLVCWLLSRSKPEPEPASQ